MITIVTISNDLCFNLPKLNDEIFQRPMKAKHLSCEKNKTTANHGHGNIAALDLIILHAQM